MDTIATFEEATAVLAPWAQITTTPRPNRMDVKINVGDLFVAASALVKAHWGYLAAITGLDHPGAISGAPEEKKWDRQASVSEPSAVATEGTLEVLYHFCSGANVLTLRVSISRRAPAVPSVCGILPTASLYERELIEMFGVDVLGTPITDRLILPDDWPQGVYPLRKDFTGLESPEKGSQER